MRAVAVSLVMISHAGAPWLQGGYIGVDVFFVLSGFLITGLLLRDASENGSVSIAKFYGNRAKRVLPAATVVLVATLLAAVGLLNYVRAGAIVKDTIWAALFSANIRFASVGTDYFARDLPPSPLQHFWSLAVEEQFYLMWPLLVGFVLVVGTNKHRPAASRTEGRRAWLGGVLAMICVASLVWSVVATAGSPSTAYFSTFTRAWELGAGALLAIFASRLGSLPATFKAAMSWGGLLVIITAAVWFTEATAFPGVAALAPVLGTVGIIIGGMANKGNDRRLPRFGARALLSRQPLRWTGDASYSLYLWHWPFLVIGAAFLGESELPFTTNLLLLAGATAVAALSYHFVENPIRNRESFRISPSSATILWPVAITPVLVLAMFLQPRLQMIPVQQAAAGARIADTLQNDGTTPAADTGNRVTDQIVSTLALAERNSPIPGILEPAVSEVADDHNYLPEACMANSGKSSSDLCDLGRKTARNLAVIFGDSHAAMYVPALDRWARKSGYRLVPVIKNSCPSIEVTPVRRDEVSSDCTDWQRWAFEQIAHLKPQLVLLSNLGSMHVAKADGSPANGSEASSLWGRGVESSIRRLKEAVPRVVYVGNAPRLKAPPTDCLATGELTLGTCVLAGEEVQFSDAANRIGAEVAIASGAEYIDTTAWYCFEGSCPLIVGTTVVWADNGHITATRSRQLAPAFTLALDKKVGS
jgi:peptidoglycan/LPS O-acetylase OafA/YrhL